MKYTAQCICAVHMAGAAAVGTVLPTKAPRVAANGEGVANGRRANGREMSHGSNKSAEHDKFTQNASKYARYMLSHQSGERGACGENGRDGAAKRQWRKPVKYGSTVGGLLCRQHISSNVTCFLDYRFLCHSGLWSACVVP